MPWLPRWWQVQVQVLVLVPMTRSTALPMPVVPLHLCGMVDTAPMHPRLQHPHQGDWMVRVWFGEPFGCVQGGGVGKCCLRRAGKGKMYVYA